jgi:hypothetical protein
MMQPIYRKTAQAQRGFNLIEVMLSLVFFALAFSAMMVGTQSIIRANMVASDLHAENSAISEVLNQIDFKALDVEARYDIEPLNRSVIRISDKSDADAKKLFYDLNVYSQPLNPDIKIADLLLYKTATGTKVYRRVQRKHSLLNDCHNYGATQYVTHGDLTCTPVPVSKIPELTTANRAYSSATPYTNNPSIHNMQTSTAGFDPRVDNVWGGIITPTAIDITDPTTGGTYDTDTTLANTTLMGTSDSAILNTGMIFDRANAGVTRKTNVSLLMPASSDTLNTNIANSRFRYNLEIGVFVVTAGQKVRVYPEASNANQITGGLGYIDVESTAANQHLTVRLGNVQPYHDDFTDRPFVGASLLMVENDGTTLSPADVVVTHMVKRPYFES